MVTSVPKNLSIKVNNAQLLMKTKPVSMDVRSREAVLETKTSPVRLEIQNRAFFDSIGLKSPESLMREDLQKSSDAVFQAAGECTREASAMMGPPWDDGGGHCPFTLFECAPAVSGAGTHRSAGASLGTRGRDG